MSQNSAPWVQPTDAEEFEFTSCEISVWHSHRIAWSRRRWPDPRPVGCVVPRISTKALIYRPVHKMRSARHCARSFPTRSPATSSLPQAPPPLPFSITVSARGG